MPIINIQNISKSYVVDPVLKNISFMVEQGDKIGLIGLNGTGKTTLFQIIAGKLIADSGQVIVQKDLKLGYLEQQTKIESDLTLYEECLSVFIFLMEIETELRSLETKISSLGNSDSEKLSRLMSDYGHLLEKFTDLNGYGFRSEVRGVLKGLGFQEDDFNKDVNILSGGQKSRLSLAKLLLQKPDILLMDEPTNHLDIDAIGWLEKFLRDYKGASLIISHDRYFLDSVATRIFFLENRELHQYNCNYSKFIVQRKKDLEIMKKQYDDQQKEISRQEEIIQRYIRYGGERYIKQARSRQKMLDRIRLLPKHQDSKKAAFQFEPDIRSGNDVLLAEGVRKSFGDLELLKGISLTVYRGDKAGLIGPNGIGKTTLFKILLSQLDADEGEIRFGHNVKPGYFDQEMSGLTPEKLVIEEIWDAYPRLDHFQVRSYLSRFLFVGDDIFKEIAELSGGERARVALLKLMLSGANLLLLDEPTNHLDIDSKEILEDAIKVYTGTVLVISHDRYFLNQVANKILDLTEDGITEYLGNYDYYLEKKKELEADVDIDEDGRTKTQIRLDKKKEKELVQKERDRKKDLKELETKISLLEDDISDIDSRLSQPEIYQDHSKVLDLSKRRDMLKEELEYNYDKWIHIND